MIQLRAYKYRIYPTKRQEELLNKTFGCVRFYWNHLVATFRSYDKDKNPNPKYKTAKEIRQEFEWMKEVSASALQQKEMDFKKYIKQFTNKKRKKKLGLPQFKKKGKSRDSYRLPNQKFKIVGNKIQLEKIGKVRIIMDRPLPDGKLISVTISKNKCNQYYASIVIETEIQPKPKTNKEVGIDLGIKSFAIQSDNVIIENPKYLGESQAKMKRIQKYLSRKVKGSNRWRKCKLKLARLHLKVTNQREWFLHNYSTYLVNNYDKIYIEDLNVNEMMKNHKLAGSISDVSWGSFIRMLEYKCKWYGKELVKVDRFYASSKTCNVCGYKNDKLTLLDREWECPNCKTLLDRDLNASINILKYGRQSSGDPTDAEVEVTKPMKRLKLKCL